MKIRFIGIQILLAALALSCLAAALHWSIFLPRRLLEKSLDAHVTEFLRTASEHATPLVHLRWEDLHRLRPDTSLVDPGEALPQTGLISSPAMIAIYQYESRCGQPPSRRLLTPEQNKLLAWAMYRCGVTPSLPKTFFATKPFMHPSGRSYALLYLQGHASNLSTPNGHEKLETEEALKDFTHVMEINELPPTIERTFTERIASSFTLDQWMVIQYRTVIGYAPTYTIAAEGHELGLQYSVYKTADFDKALKDSYLAININGGEGLYRGNIRWSFDQASLKRGRYLATLLGFLGGGALLTQIVWLLFRMRRVREEETKRRVFSLQLLTHEIRTPAASLKLNLDALQASYDALPETSQISLLGAMSAEARMGRVLHASQAYLQSGDTSLRTHVDTCDDVGTYLEELLVDYKDQIDIDIQTPHLPACFDKHWVGYCIRNLTENALRHGKPPVKLSSSTDRDYLYIQVSDQGIMSMKEFKQLAKPFIKGGHSSGLGLGLSIVHRLVAAMGGQLTFRPKPTTFTLKFKRGGV